MSTATPRQKATVGGLVLVLITVLWFQFVWRGHHEASAGAVDDGSAAALVTDATDASGAPVDGAASGDAGAHGSTDPTATTDATTAPTTATTAVPMTVDHVAELRLVHQAVTATGVRLVGYVPATADSAQVQLEAGYGGLVAFLAELRTRAPHSTIATLAVDPEVATLSVTLTITWTAS